jgi:Holliday junction resolvase
MIGLQLLAPPLGKDRNMKTETFNRLRILYNEFGSRQFGKICQKLLAIAFLNAGFNHIVEREVQGVDIDVANDKGERYSIEVKTTITKFIMYGEKDLKGLQMRKKDGYRPLLAVLHLARFSEWIFAEIEHIKSGNIYIDSLRIHRKKNLEKVINHFFDEVVEMHIDGTINEGQKFLDDILKNKDKKVKNRNKSL